MEVDAAVLLIGGESEEEVHVVRGADLVLVERVHRAARHPVDELGAEVADRHAVVAESAPGMPDRPGRGQACGRGRLVERVEAIERGIGLRQACLVREQLPHGDALLAGGGELGPVVGDEIVEVENCLLYTSPSPRD